MEREDWNRRHGEAGPLFGVDPNRFLVAEVDSLAPGRALDLACGAGRNAVWLAERGWTVTGVDFSDVALENARGLAAERAVEVEWVHADVREWMPEQAAFDLVAILYLQIPVDERRLVHGRAAAAVAPGGTMLVVGHDRENLVSGTGGPQDARVLLDAEEVAAELNGLEIEKAGRVLRPVEGERDAVDTLVRARRTRPRP
ncbi:MAG TPA: class I SAM-dependent methyltransferase [Gaiellaceae bacterium]|jgi:2-polyprenyl-3-methyl-5-hydroxy-6-metoxy-1,4-benzoquinol methylase